jgi:hypothetical protein
MTSMLCSMAIAEQTCANGLPVKRWRRVVRYLYSRRCKNVPDRCRQTSSTESNVRPELLLSANVEEGFEQAGSLSHRSRRCREIFPNSI